MDEDRVRSGVKAPEKPSEIPCRVSSDLHEWSNDLGTVSMGIPAKLQYQ
jgi:hypothetical protein